MNRYSDNYDRNAFMVMFNSKMISKEELIADFPGLSLEDIIYCFDQILRSCNIKGESFFNYLTRLELIDEIVIHKFKYYDVFGEDRAGIQVKFENAYALGEKNDEYKSSSLEWRDLSKEDPMTRAIFNIEEQTSNFVSGEKAGKIYHKIIVGKKIYGVVINPILRERFPEPIYLKAVNLVLSAAREKIISFIKTELFAFQTSINHNYDNSDPQGYDNVLQSVLESNAELLHAYYGFTKIVFIPSTHSSIMFNNMNTPVLFDFQEVETNVKGISISNNELIALGKYSDQTKFSVRDNDGYSEDHDDEFLVTIQLYSKYYDRDFVRYDLDLTRFLYSLGDPIKNCYGKKLSMIRKNQEQEHFDRCDKIAEINDIKEIKNIAREDLLKYFSTLSDKEIKFIYEGNIISRDSDLKFGHYSLQEMSSEYRIIPLLDGQGLNKVTLLIPQDYKIKFERVKNMCERYINALKNSFKNIMSNYDPMTGLLNVNAFNILINKYFQEMKELDIPQARITVGYFDSYKFKIYNELFGHDIGDTVLKYTARKLSEIFSLFARLGGDEHAAILKYFVDDGNLSDYDRKLLLKQGYISEEGTKLMIDNFIVFAEGIIQPIYFDEYIKYLSPDKKMLASCSLAHFMRNFYKSEKNGIEFRKYARDDDNYTMIIKDEGKLEIFIQQVKAELDLGNISLKTKGFDEYVVKHNPLGSYIYVEPKMSYGFVTASIGDEQYEYGIDLYKAAEKEYQKNKK